MNSLYLKTIILFQYFYHKRSRRKSYFRYFYSATDLNVEFYHLEIAVWH